VPSKKATTQSETSKKTSEKQTEAQPQVTQPAAATEPGAGPSNAEPAAGGKKKSTKKLVTPKPEAALETAGQAATTATTPKPEAAPKAAGQAVTTAMTPKPEAAPKTASQVAAPAATIPEPGAPKKAAAEQKAAPAVVTKIIAKVDIGYGNILYLRGEGAGLTWEKGVPMDYTEGEWSWSVTTSASQVITFKFLINDTTWSSGGNLTVTAGETLISTPSF